MSEPDSGHVFVRTTARGGTGKLRLGIIGCGAIVESALRVAQKRSASGSDDTGGGKVSVASVEREADSGLAFSRAAKQAAAGALKAPAPNDANPAGYCIEKAIGDMFPVEQKAKMEITVKMETPH